jgi:hypothetical protein
MTDRNSLIEKFGRALNTGDFDLMAEVLVEDYVEEYPQSGEVIRGRANVLAMIENYPGRSSEQTLGQSESLTVKSFDAFKAVAPTFAVVRVEGAGDNGVATLRATYPDGSKWWIVNIFTLRGNRIAHSRTFFAPDFPAPDWRAKWAEQTEGL